MLLESTSPVPQILSVGHVVCRAVVRTQAIPIMDASFLCNLHFSIT